MDNNTILLAEDSAAQRLLLQHAVKEIAAETATLEAVEGGRAVLSYLEGNGGYGNRAEHPFPDLILLDLNMPGMDGFEVLSYLRASPEMAEVPILVLSSLRDIVAVDRAYRLGADGYLTKPANYEQLLVVVACIHRTLSEGRGNLEQLRTLPEFREPPLCCDAGEPPRRVNVPA